MEKITKPFTTLIHFEDGSLEPERDLSERRLSDMAGMYLKADGRSEDSLIYAVHGIPVPQSNSEIASSTTVIEPGRVGREYHMTKGHFHATRERAEVYLTVSGEGLLLMATEDGDHVAEPMRPGTANYVPGGWAHRSVNVGDGQLIFYAVYPADAGYDYGTIEEEGFPVLVVEGHDGPEIVPNPRYRDKLARG